MASPKIQEKGTLSVLDAHVLTLVYHIFSRGSRVAAATERPPSRDGRRKDQRIFESTRTRLRSAVSGIHGRGESRSGGRGIERLAEVYLDFGHK